jgi:hypothetical protein
VSARLDERAQHPTPGADRVRDGRQLMVQEPPTLTGPALVDDFCSGIVRVRVVAEAQA